MLGVYYNEKDDDAAGQLERLIAIRALPAGDVDRRDVRGVRPDDITGYVSAHFFAGIGGWPLALRSVGWHDDRPVWTASLPCQPWSRAGKRGGFDDLRHLWPDFEKLVAARRPPVLFGEQSVDAAPWLDAVRGRLDSLEYAVGAMPFQAAFAGSEHGRPRYYFVADADDEPRRLEQQCFGSIRSPSLPAGMHPRRRSSTSSFMPQRSVCSGWIGRCFARNVAVSWRASAA